MIQPLEYQMVTKINYLPTYVLEVVVVTIETVVTNNFLHQEFFLLGINPFPFFYFSHKKMLSLKKIKNSDCDEIVKLKWEKKL